MLPPRTVYSLVIRNRSNHKARVAVTYTDIDGNVHHAEIRVPANGTTTASEKTTKKGAAYFAMEIVKVAIVDSTRDGSASSISAPFPAVNGPRKDYPIDVVRKNGALALVANYSD
jgi:hypothetical protein